MEPNQDVETVDKPSGPGRVLREARESRGLTVADMAAKLNLDSGTINAIDNDDYARLPAPIFVRGYLKNYARLVGADEVAVLAAYQPPQIEEPPRPAPQKLPLALNLLLPLILAAKWLVIAGLLFGAGWLAWLGYQAWEERSQSLSDEPAALNLPQMESSPADDSAEGDAPSLLLPPVEEPAEPEVEPPVVETAPPVAPETPAEVIPEPPAPRVATPEPIAPGMSVSLRFGADSWVEIRDRNGRQVYGLIKKGNTRELTLQPPAEFVLGNADQVQMTLDGQSFDLSRYNRNNVARFTLEP